MLGSYSDFLRKVLAVTAKIPYGETRSYQWVASKIGDPKSSRAVGQALARNPIPGIIPCHRVIRKDGNAGNYFLGRALKESLLMKEKAASGK